MHRFEDLAQHLIETSLARLLRERLQATEVLQALVRAIDDAQAALQVRDTPPPNHFWVTMYDADLAQLQTQQPRLADDLAEQVRQIMLQMGLRLDVPPRVLVHGALEVPPHQIRVIARWIAADLPRGETRPESAQPDATQARLPRRPFLIVDGRRQVDLNDRLVNIGRSRESDVIVDDRRVSRRHLELRWLADSARFLAVDLGSSGGTRLNGHPIKQCTLEAGDVISLGGYELIYGEEFALSSTGAMPPASGSTSTEAEA
jgi:hypothetical protein